MRFDYGKEGIEIILNSNWNTTILSSIRKDPIKNPKESIKSALKNPLGTDPLKKILEDKKQFNRICVIVSDATRPVPSYIILEGLVEELNEYGVSDDKILVLIATGLHRSSRKEDIERILGKQLKDRINVRDHDATDKDNLTFLGYASDGIPIYVNKTFLESDVKILTGYVEPHFFFGFAGGRKSIIPGIAGVETILTNHSAKNIASEYARFGVYEQNPMAANSTEISKIIGTDFVINVCINESHEIVNIAAGDLERVHENLVRYQMEHVFREIALPYDIVICGNGGYPLDLNLYQAVKSMAIGEMAVKEGGTIVSVNECSEGVGIGQDEFKEMLFSGMGPKEIYQKILSEELILPDQWEIQVLARVLMKAEIYVISKLKEKELGKIGLKHADTVEEAIEISIKKHGPNSRILLLPNGPQVLPLLKK